MLAPRKAIRANAKANLETPPTPQMVMNKMVDISSSFSSGGEISCDGRAAGESVCMMAGDERKRQRAVIH